MSSVLAERTINVDRDGEPRKTLRVVIGLPVKRDDDYGIQVEIHGPDEGDVLERVFSGEDEWQAVRVAFRIVYDLAYSRVHTGSKLTFGRDENWTDEMSAPLPHW